MLQVVVSGVNRLVALMMSGKTFEHPMKGLRDKRNISLWMKRLVYSLHFPFNSSRISSGYRARHHTQP